MCGRVPLALLAGTWISCYLAGPCVGREVGAYRRAWARVEAAYQPHSPLNSLVTPSSLSPLLLSPLAGLGACHGHLPSQWLLSSIISGSPLSPEMSHPRPHYRKPEPGSLPAHTQVAECVCEWRAVTWDCSLAPLSLSALLLQALGHVLCCGCGPSSPFTCAPDPVPQLAASAS